ncbi:hypothetical protein EHP00_23 [Ecytonucleospora hepatopenaei]|uniref:DNA polymerase alpha subunit B n=1 Tax=Ecytonucleospora hepatopenaei TaxID=646526 RepID=A0A1W0E5J2_9MICR|nr:hypothetical protein EHP00_23 [Ecytonucleospora hepatopenaei]
MNCGRKKAETENSHNDDPQKGQDMILKKLQNKNNKFTKKQKLTYVVCNNKEYESFFADKYDKQKFIKNRIDLLYNSYLKSIKISSFDNLTVHKNTEIWIIGSLTTITGEKINSENICLENSDFSQKYIKIDISKLKNFLFFNGQVVAFRGFLHNFFKNKKQSTDFSDFDTSNSSLNDNEMYGSEIITGNVHNNLVFKSNEFSIKPHVSNPIKSKKALSFVVAKGPFTEILIENYARCDASAVILLGPFTEKRQDFSDFIVLCKNTFKKKMSVKVFLVPSTEDKEFDPCYPQNAREIDYNDVICLSNPAIIELNDHSVVINNFDILKDLSAYSLTDVTQNYMQTKKDFEVFNRMICRQTLLQKNLLPVFPPQSFVYSQNNLSLNIIPNVYIISSIFDSFEMMECACHFINMGNIGGLAYECVFDQTSQKFIVNKFI